MAGLNLRFIRLAGAYKSLYMLIKNLLLIVLVCLLDRLKNEELVDLLLQAGGNVNSRDFYGHTPLW